MAECNAAGSAPAARGGSKGCGLALGRLVRKLRRQSRMLSLSARPASAAARCQQYDPLSYARNFDLGTALDGGYSFASRFVVAASSARQQQQ